jgi:hypothetical protein
VSHEQFAQRHQASRHTVERTALMLLRRGWGIIMPEQQTAPSPEHYAAFKDGGDLYGWPPGLKTPRRLEVRQRTGKALADLTHPDGYPYEWLEIARRDNYEGKHHVGCWFIWMGELCAVVTGATERALGEYRPVTNRLYPDDPRQSEAWCIRIEHVTHWINHRGIEYRRTTRRTAV